MWEEFKRAVHRHPRESKPFVSVHTDVKSPRIHFNHPCAVWLGAHKAKAVIYLWDNEAKKAAFRIADVGAENSYKISVRSSQAYVSARLFLEHIGNPQTGRYRATLNDEVRQIEVDFGEADHGDR